MEYKGFEMLEECIELEKKFPARKGESRLCESCSAYLTGKYNRKGCYYCIVQDSNCFYKV